MDYNFKAVWGSITDCWAIKVLGGCGIAALDFLVGPLDAAFIALWVLVGIDTLTRWLAIAYQTMNGDPTRKMTWGEAIYCSCRSGAINSEMMRKKFVPKIIAYLALLISANVLTHVTQPKFIFGVDILGSIDDFVSVFLALTEAKSITENLVELGIDALAPLLIFFRRKTDQLCESPPGEQPPKGGAGK